MNKILSMTLSAAFAAVAACTTLPALAANAECDKKADEKKLAGAAKTSFLKKCEADGGPMAAKDVSAACEKSASDKKLAGAAKTSHIKKCESDAGGSPSAAKSANDVCEKSAADMKLAGAAKTSHLKKCKADQKTEKAEKAGDKKPA